MILIELLFVLVNIAMAYYHCLLIKQNRIIQHGWWTLGYGLACGIVLILTWNWILFFCLILIRKVVFDISLNLFRGLPVFHISRETKSLIDQLHNAFFGGYAIIYQSVYFVAIVVLNFFI